MPIPGTDGTFVYLVDSFGLPVGSKHREATVNFLSLLGSPRAQNAFNPIKGSTPPRTDADTTLYDALAQKNIRDLQSNALTFGRQVKIKSPEFIGELDAAMRQFAIDGQVESVLTMLRNRYDRLQNP